MSLGQLILAALCFAKRLEAQGFGVAAAAAAGAVLTTPAIPLAGKTMAWDFRKNDQVATFLILHMWLHTKFNFSRLFRQPSHQDFFFHNSKEAEILFSQIINYLYLVIVLK
jgi:hypothetical protein